ncbi:MAG: MarR family transcriptional regulator [Alphaproteobacteria bacterium]|nr:MAG: MarR family transcriptional regulator [Alphaproteobacteria bacterium]
MTTKRSLRREFLGTLANAARHLSHFVDRRARHLGLTGAQIRVLSRLRRREGATQAELAADMEMRPISLSGLIDKLNRQGLVERCSDASDRRINRLHLTPAGRIMALRIDRFREEIAREVLGDADAAALEAGLSVLHGLKRRLKEQRDETSIAAE